MALGEVIFGQNPVKEALLKNKRDEFYRLWIQEGDGGSYSSDEKMIARAKELGCTISYATKHDLNMLTESRPHQVVALDCTPLEMENIESLLEENGSGKNAAETERNREHSLWLALDEPPANFGLSSNGALLNINGVVVCAKNSAPLSPVVSKASSGAMESIKVYQTNAMHKFLVVRRRRFQRRWFSKPKRRRKRLRLIFESTNSFSRRKRRFWFANERSESVFEDCKNRRRQRQKWRGGEQNHEPVVERLRGMAIGLLPAHKYQRGKNVRRRRVGQ